MPRDFYDLFDVPADASEDEIESAYNEMVKEYHPDINDSDDAEDKFKAIQTAYETLTDDDERHKYDELGHVLYVRSYVSGDLNGFDFTATAPEDDPISDSSTASSTPSRTRSTSSYSSSQSSYSSYTSSSSSTSTPNAESVSGYGSAGTTAPATDIPFKPKVHRSIIVAVTSVISLFALYLYGMFSLALTDYASLGAFIDHLAADPKTAILQLDLALKHPADLITAITTAPLEHLNGVLLFVSGLALPLTIATIVRKLGSGQRLLWLFPIGTAIPTVTFLGTYASGVQIPGTIGAFLYVGVPFIAIAAFVFDVTAHIVRKYVEFYIAHYKRRYTEYRTRLGEFNARLRETYALKWRRFKRRWKGRYTETVDRVRDTYNNYFG